MNSCDCYDAVCTADSCTIGASKTSIGHDDDDVFYSKACSCFALLLQVPLQLERVTFDAAATGKGEPGHALSHL